MINNQETVREEIIKEQAEEIAKLQRFNQARHEEKEMYRLMAEAYTVLLMSIMADLAIDTILEGTHRQRTAKMRQIVQNINYQLTKEPTSYKKEIQDMDDIPF